MTAIVIGPAPAFETGQNLRGKGLVKFNQADVAPAKAVTREQTLCGGYGAITHA